MLFPKLLHIAGIHGVAYLKRVALYAMLPWDFSPVSLRISQELRDTCTAEMVRHEFLSSTVERTVFSDGTTVCANFGDQEEWGIPAGDFKIYREK